MNIQSNQVASQMDSIQEEVVAPPEKAESARRGVYSSLKNESFGNGDSKFKRSIEVANSSRHKTPNLARPESKDSDLWV